MKPLVLTMHHFGPFIDETIDFTTLGKELFLITGPTGGGKTTIFDGLCYALYGEGSNTARQSREMKSQFGNPMEMMWVEFTFSLRDKVYRIRRIPEQERKKERGEGTAKQKHEAVLYEIAEGKEVLLSSSVAEIGEKVFQIMGINANQFRQIVMLPQGEFSRLLKAKEEERVELLKSIFRMDLYNKLRDKTAEKLKEIRKKHDDLLVKMNTEKEHFKAADASELKEALDADDKTLAYLLSVAQRAVQSDEEEMAKAILEQEKQQQELEQLGITLAAGEQINARFVRLDETLEALQRLEEQSDEMKAQKDYLKKGRLAEKLRPMEQNLKASRQREAEAEQGKNKAQAVLEELKAKGEVLDKAYQKVMDKSYDETLEALKVKLGKMETLLEYLSDFKEKQTKSHTLLEERKNLEEKVALTQKNKEEAAGLEERARALERQTYTYEHQSQNFAYEENTRKQHIQKLETIKQQLLDIDAREQAIAALRAEWKTAQAACRKSELEYREMLKQQKSAAAQNLAASLKEGEACPVCGSVHHPAPHKGTTEALSEEQITAAENRYRTLSITCENLKSKGSIHKEELDQRKKELGAFSHDVEDFFGEAPEIKTTIEALDTLEAEQKALYERWSLLKNGLDAVKQEEKTLIKKQEVLKEQLKTALKEEEALKKAKDKESLLFGQMAQIESAILKISREIGVAVDEAHFENTQKEIAAQVQGGKVLISEKTGYKANIQAQVQTLKTKQAAIEADFEQFSKQLMKWTDENKKLEIDFRQALLEAKLDQTTYNRFREVSEEQLKNSEEQLKEYEFQLKSTHQQSEMLKTELSGKTPVDLEGFKKKQQEKEQRLEAIRNVVVNRCERITANKKQIETLKKLAGELDVVEREQGIYTRLDQTIKGTLAGRPKISFERYILSAYLQDILESANLFLERMSSRRYRLEIMEDLKKGGGRGLEIEVVDAYTGLRRSANTLSGGETFMAALSMALGLSDIVQSYAGGIALDTIFIDEGFATLDPEALDNAINCLLSIKNDGRTVGIISHVEELKDRIDTKISVEKTEQGSHIIMNSEGK